ncbi:TIGR02266 family protein [Myxococcota bacterium]|nr:TIGR02266 family protein [Myxococcota bacterium]MBU1433036.1 TIGR02266 family protein [Myxococcota bacterium]MBU1899929.1 TIGR02266 family protein [Myxococcota bacterium]
MSSPYEDLLCQLKAEEDEASRRELTMLQREQALEAEILGIEGRCRVLQKRLARLLSEGDSEAGQVLKALPRVAPPPGVAERHRGFQARQVALEERARGLQARDGALDFLQRSLSDAYQRLDECSRWTSHLEARQDPRRTAAFFSAPSPTHQRRGADRQRLDVRISLTSQDNFFSGFAQDISGGGLFIASFDLLPIGHPVEVAFTLPGGLAMRADAIVRWVRTVDPSQPQRWPGMGVEFLNLDKASQEAIHAFMDLRAPLFFDEIS